MTARLSQCAVGPSSPGETTICAMDDHDPQLRGDFLGMALRWRFDSFHFWPSKEKEDKRRKLLWKMVFHALQQWYLLLVVFVWVSFGEDIMTLQFKRLVVEGTPIFWWPIDLGWSWLSPGKRQTYISCWNNIKIDRHLSCNEACFICCLKGVHKHLCVLHIRVLQNVYIYLSK